jgi:hypothetical protein
MSLIAVIGAGIQLALLLFTKWFTTQGKKEEERKALYEEGKKALADRDVSKLNACIACIQRL